MKIWLREGVQGGWHKTRVVTLKEKQIGAAFTWDLTI